MYKRVLLKLSGEALAGEGSTFDPKVLDRLAADIKEILSLGVETAIVVGELYRHNGEWKFNAIGSGFQGGLYALCQNFGVNV